MRAFADTPIEYLKGVGPKRAELLRSELGVSTFRDLLLHIPFRYVDRSRIYSIHEVVDDTAYIQVKGKIIDISTSGQGRQQRLIALINDGSGSMELVWFKGIRWVITQLKPGNEYVAFGKPNIFKGRINLPHPELTPASEFGEMESSPYQAVYSTTEKLRVRGLDSRGIARLMRTLIQMPEFDLQENLGSGLLHELRLPGRVEAMREIHLPTHPDRIKRAEARLKFEELFFLQLWLLKHKHLRKEKSQGIVFPKVGQLFNALFQRLPFDLTQAQKKVMKEIRRDLGSGKQMNRLLQGDVGSGKTLVALMSILIALDNDCQACIMAPTEILAIQHFRTLTGFLEGIPVNIGLLTGSTRKSERRTLHEGLIDGSLHILVGTHALLEDTVQFKKLGLVVIDEQHRFGVEQRARLWEKGDHPPHILVMTATPIPRTLAMTLYGHLDYSVIDELPPGRKPVRTLLYSDRDRLKVFHFMRQQIAQGRQVYVVYPLIQESEALDLKDLMDGYESIVREFQPPEFAVSIVHGKMKPADKDYEMQRFKRGETQIMVATTVIEVGVDIPNASVMVIENAERFGLSQLHQLRGRVGRGADQSWCILMGSLKLTNDARTRLKTMVESNDGFLIADVDMRLRGPGDMMGTRQSGNLDIRIADLVKDEKILHRAREEAIRLLEDDPLLEKPENLRYHWELSERDARSGMWSRIL